MKRGNAYWLVIFTSIGCAIPFIYLLVAYFTHLLSANPILTAQQYLGDYAITFLVLSVACTPLNTITGFEGFVRIRRILGLFAFFYAALHLFIFVGLDYGFDFSAIFETAANKPYIYIGAGVFLILLVLALTSSNRVRESMGRNWKRLQRITYIANLGAVLHYGLAVKGNLFRLQGNILRPLIYAGIVIILLILRLPPVEKGIIDLRTKKANGRRPDQP
jgi:methionine sulfoxide reductase heme-binding subunit